MIPVKDRNYETEKAAHEKTRLERNKQQADCISALSQVRGLEAKVKRLEEELRASKGWEERECKEAAVAAELLDELGAIVDAWRAR